MHDRANKQTGVNVPTGRSAAQAAAEGMDAYNRYRAEQLRLEAERLVREAQEAAAKAGL